jgi:hypothetical protein
LPYSKTTWTDRSVEKPLTFTMQTNADGTITLIPAEGTIVAPGTAITSALLNNMENGIASAARKTENQDMGGFLYSNMRIAIPSNIYIGAGGGIDLNNSDIIGINNMFMADAATSDSEAMQWLRSTTPLGSTDYSEYDTLRVYDGKLYLNSIPIGSSDTGYLWSGGYYLNANQSITPSKPLQSCTNGWCLIWGDYDPATQTNNTYDYVHTFIPKRNAQYNTWHNALMGSYATATTMATNIKQFQFTNTTITGHDMNSSANVGNNNADVVLRWVVEF